MTTKSNAIILPQSPNPEEFRQLRNATIEALNRWFDAFEDRMLGIPVERQAILKAAYLQGWFWI